MTPNNEPAAPPELAPQAPPTEPQLAPAPAPTGAPPAATPAAPATPDAAALQAQLAAAEERAAQLERQAREHQAAFTRSQQQLRAVVGAQQPPPDPLRPHIDKLMSKGYSEQEARDFAEAQLDMLQPIIQQQQQYFASLQATQQVGDVLNAAFGQDAASLSDPAIAQFVRNELNLAALNGRTDVMNAEYALALADIEAGKRRRSAASKQTPPPAQPQAPLNINGMLGPQGGFQPPFQPRPVEKQASPEQLALRAKLEQTLLSKPQTPNNPS